jgi:hypothetical protein
MAITAFTSTAIIDATTIGTTVLTASSAGIAADAIGLGTTDDVTFNSVGCVDGSFSGNLTSEVGGSYKLYNLGAEGDADTEYLDMFWNSNIATIQPKSAGSGAARNMDIATASGRGRIRFESSGNVALMYDSSNNLFIGNGYVQVTKQLLPSVTGTTPLGNSANRWSNVASVDGDFSGNMTLSNLPTSDPAVAGRLYTTTGGSLKVSAG